MCAPYLERIKTYILLWFIKRNSVHLTAALSKPILIIFTLPKPEKNVQNRACI